MSEERKREMRNAAAAQAAKLAALMSGTPPILLLCNPSTGARETAEDCPLSGDAGRVAVLSMTFLNPLALKAAAVIEGGMA